MVIKETGEKFETPPVGLQPAVCVNVFDVGFQKGMEGRILHKCVLLWELAEKKPDGERFMVTKIYTTSSRRRVPRRLDLLRPGPDLRQHDVGVVPRHVPVSLGALSNGFLHGVPDAGVAFVLLVVGLAPGNGAEGVEDPADGGAEGANPDKIRGVEVHAFLLSR